ncbi:MAG: glycosyltransferase [Candidatus Magasanikbacteria bacterium]
MKTTKLLIISLSAGSGHVQAAKAIKETADTYPQVVCEHIDMAGYITRVFKASAISSYHVIIEHFPKLWKSFFDITDNENFLNAYYTITKYLKLINSFPLYKKIQQFNPDYILCSHFLAADVLLNTTSSNRPRVPVSVLVTDYGLHPLWAVSGVSHYFVATSSIEQTLKKNHHVPKSHITVSGIPVYRSFYENSKKEDLRTRYHLPLKNQTILLLSGGQGLMETDTLAKKIFSYSKPVTLIAIAGKNEELRQNLLRLSAPPHINYRVIGWTHDMASYIKLSDVVISKPGGLTTTECMISGVPLIAVNPIPGQEEFNVEFIQQKNLGALAKDSESLLKLLHHFLEKKEPLESEKIQPASDIILKKIITAPTAH